VLTKETVEGRKVRVINHTGWLQRNLRAAISSKNVFRVKLHEHNLPLINEMLYTISLVITKDKYRGWF
jgi:hypothetical protein